MRVSVSSWRTQDADVEALLALLVRIKSATTDVSS